MSYKQEALLLQTDRATRCIRQKLVNCCRAYDSLGTSCTTNPEQIEVMELNGCSRPTCNKLCAFSYDALDCRRCNPQARPSTSCADHTISLQWRIFLSPEFGVKFQTEVPLSLEVDQRKLLCQKKQAISVYSFRYNTVLWRTDRHTTTAYTAPTQRRAVTKLVDGRACGLHLRRSSASWLDA